MNSKHAKRLLSIATAAILLMATIAAGCGHATDKPANAVADTTDYTTGQLDTLSFAAIHHYSENYNFVVKADSVQLFKQQPEEVVNNMHTDTIAIYRHDHIVVADIRIMPADSIDSVWVQVARDQATFGWTRESNLLPNVVPDDPISQFISTFSDIHLLIFLITISVIAVAYMLYTIFKRNAKIVHFNDINTFYPTLLALTVASSATLYASIQTFAPETWQHFYFHPTLNPFNVKPILGIFLVSVWAMLIIAIATVDVVRSMLPTGEAMLYVCGLAAVCALNYIVFSIATLYYIGYLMFAAYLYFAIKAYFTRFRSDYVCGNCGARMAKKGHCPICGAYNK